MYLFVILTFNVNIRSSDLSTTHPCNIKVLHIKEITVFNSVLSTGGNFNSFKLYL